MNEELQSWSDDIIYKHALTFSHEELAGMYSLCNKREQDYLKEIKALRLILQSHGEVIEMNAELNKHIESWQDQANFYSQMKDELWEDNIKLEKENARLREQILKLKALILYTDEVLSSEQCGSDIQLKQWNEFIRCFSE